MNDISVPQQYDLETAALKVPPHSIEAEQAVLGGLMLDNNAWERVSDAVSDGDFYRHDHRLIFRAIYTLAERNSPFDVVTLSEQLDKEGHLSQVGGLGYLGELAKNTPSVANIKAYAQIIRERATLRQLIGISNDIADMAYAPQGKSAVEVLDEAERQDLPDRRGAAQGRWPGGDQRDPGQDHRPHRRAVQHQRGPDRHLHRLHRSGRHDQRPAAGRPGDRRRPSVHG